MVRFLNDFAIGWSLGVVTKTSGKCDDVEQNDQAGNASDYRDKRPLEEQ
jgi:hypothetical protein